MNLRFFDFLPASGINCNPLVRLQNDACRKTWVTNKRESVINVPQKSSIEWTEKTWNPVTGCTKISAGCKNCYAYKMALRLQSMGHHKYTNGFDVTLHPECLEDPYRIAKPSVIFVNSMSDLFHEDVPLRFIHRVFDVMKRTPHHSYQILTKRAERLAEVAPALFWPSNVWQGVTVEDHAAAHRIDLLRSVPAVVRFISFEPLLEDVGKVDLTGINWAIVGGESGAGARPVQENWILRIKEQCDTQQTLFYFKQWGGFNKKKNGRELLGRTWDDRPSVAHLPGYIEQPGSQHELPTSPSFRCRELFSFSNGMSSS